MRTIAREGTCTSLLVLCLAAPAAAVDVDSLAGTWRGERDGLEVVWQVEMAGRLRVDGRPASWMVRDDSLFVDFDPAEDCDRGGERAVYQILASEPGNGRRSLFVYGFDLGTQGLLLVRDEGSLWNDSAALASPAAAAAGASPPGRSSGQRSTGGATSKPSPGAPAQRAGDPVVHYPKKTP